VPTTIVFNATGSIVSFTAPVIGTYDITAFGAEGGVNADIGGARNPGLGAEASGQFNLTVGQTLLILAVHHQYLRLRRRYRSGRQRQDRQDTRAPRPASTRTTT